MDIVEVKNVMLKYGDFVALNNINLSIKKGQIYGLVGNNGAGKTTLMRLLTGQLKIQQGKISILGAETEPEQENIRSKIGALIECPGFFDEMTGRQNLEYFRIQFGIKDKGVVPRTLDKVGLSNAANKKYKDFSLGMKQRLGIALALLNSPELLILDEPINGLDPEGIIEIRNMLLELNRKDAVTILITSHILTELSNVATYYGFLNKGCLLEQMSAEELLLKCNMYLEIKVDNAERLVNLIKTKLNLTNVTISFNNSVLVYDGMDLASEISKLAVYNGLKLMSIDVHTSDLENYYMNLIGVEDNE